MQVIGYNNTPFRWTPDAVTAWADAYDLTTAEWVMTVRAKAYSNSVVLQMKKSTGGAIFGANVVTFLADLADVVNLSGIYEFDYGFVPVLGGEFIRIAGGQITFYDGVTFL